MYVIFKKKLLDGGKRMENLEGVMPTENGGNQAVTPTATEIEATETTTTPNVETETPKTTEKMFSRAQVEQLMKRRVERSHNSFFKRYGVQDLNGLDALFEQTKKFKQMQDDYGAINLKNGELLQENAFLRNNIDEKRYQDVKAYFKGNGIDFSAEALVEALKSHPEWLKPTQPTTTINTLGVEQKGTAQPNEKEIASRFLGVKI